MTDDIAKAVVRALEPRFASIDRRFESIEARLDQCATKADLAACATKADLAACATKADLAACATKADLTGFATQAVVERLAEKQETFAVALERGLGGIRADMAGQRADMMTWMFLFWVGQAFVVLAYLRAAE